MLHRPVLFLVLSDRHHYVREATVGIGHFVRETTDWLMHRVGWPDGLDRVLADAASMRRAVGIIAFCRDADHVRRLAAAPCPAVNLSSRLLDSPVPLVIPDNLAVGRLGARHLIGQGLRRLAFVRVPNLPYAEEREAGFLAEAREAGLDPIAEAVAGAAALRRWLPGLPHPIGIMAPDDPTAVAVVAAALDADLRVPDQVAVIGADDAPLWCETSPVSLSSVPTEGRRVGYQAAALLQALRRGEPPPAGPVRIAPLRVVARTSTDVVPLGDPALAEALRRLRLDACRGCDVSEVVQAAGVSRRTFDRKVKEALGRTPHEELERVRIERASDLLLESALTVSQVARKCGFSRVSYFARVFRRERGCTPGAFRKAHVGHE